MDYQGDSWPLPVEQLAYPLEPLDINFWILRLVDPVGRPDRRSQQVYTGSLNELHSLLRVAEGSLILCNLDLVLDT